VPLSSLPSSAFCPSGEVTGVPTSVSLTLCPSSRAPSVVPSPSDLSPLPVVPVSLPPPLSSVSSSLPVSRTPTPRPPVPPRPSRTPSRLPSLPSSTPTASSPPTCGRRLSSSGALWRSSVMFCARARSTNLVL
jgi:hypothetical protein